MYAAAERGVRVRLILDDILLGSAPRELKPDAAACALWIEGRDDCGKDGSITWGAEDGETWTREPATGFWQRFKSSLLRFVPMEKYL